MSYVATPGVDYGDVVLPIMARPGDTEACFNIVIEDDILVEESQECLMASFTAEDLVNLEIGSSSSVCCIVDDDSKYIIIIIKIVVLSGSNVFVVLLMQT